MPLDLLAEALEVVDGEFRVNEERRVSSPVFNFAAAASVGVLDKARDGVFDEDFARVLAEVFADVLDGAKVARCSLCVSLFIVDGSEKGEDVRDIDEPAAFTDRGINTWPATLHCKTEA